MQSKYKYFLNKELTKSQSGFLPEGSPYHANNNNIATGAVDLTPIVLTVRGQNKKSSHKPYKV